jgi:hypothetical protein
VDLLNENEVDISLEPIDSYGDGEDIEEGEEEEDGEDECEEIEEEVFTEGGHKKKRSRTINYTEVEDTCLVRAWSQVTVDPVTECDQTGKRYWQHIEDKFFKFMPRVASPVTRTYQSLQGRWDAIKTSCSRWSVALEQVRNAPPSGATIDDYMSNFCEMHLVDCVKCICVEIHCVEMHLVHHCRRVLQWKGTKPWPVQKEDLSTFNIVGGFLNIVRSGKIKIKN